MKKLIIFSFSALTILAETACSKVRTCECANPDLSYLMVSEKKSTQKKQCDDYAVAAGTSCSVK